jgi:hypothetical protein
MLSIDAPSEEDEWEDSRRTRYEGMIGKSSRPVVSNRRRGQARGKICS